LSSTGKGVEVGVRVRVGRGVRVGVDVRVAVGQGVGVASMGVSLMSIILVATKHKPMRTNPMPRILTHAVFLFEGWTGVRGAG